MQQGRLGWPSLFTSATKNHGRGGKREGRGCARLGIGRTRDAGPIPASGRHPASSRQAAPAMDVPVAAAAWSEADRERKERESLRLGRRELTQIYGMTGS